MSKENKQMTTINLTDEHLQVINRALEVYYRMRSGQIGMALDTAYDKYIDWESRDLIEKMVRKLVIDDNKLSNPSASYGFDSDEIGDAKIAYEIQCVFRQYLAVKRNNGYFDYSSVDFRDPLKSSNVPLPQIPAFKPYKDYWFTKTQSAKINKFFKDKNYDGLWNYVDSLKLNLPKGEKKEIIPGFGGVVMRIWKPTNKS